MADYTIVNLREVEDQAPRFGLSPGLEARFAREALGCRTVGLSYQRLAPGFRVPFGHRHARQEEVYVLLAGSARLRLDDEVRDLEQWDAVRVDAGTMRAFEAGPEGAEILAVGAPAGSPPDVEMEPGWWTD
jgi:uncharacterized cupin superfamily protein